MPSVFGWVDFREKDRRNMLDLVQLFREQDTRDELGIGTIRDAFADHFFPGTSTVQTRAKYMLFVPWMYLDLERKKTPSEKIARAARDREVSLIDALVKNGEKDGVIGIDARKSLQRLPSNIYWSGMENWGIRWFSGSQDQYHRNADFFYRYRRRDRGRFLSEGDEEGSDGSFNWHPGLPEPPEKFPEEASLSLSYEEASYLQDRILLLHGESLLAKLLLYGRAYESDFPWEHPVVSSLKPELLEDIQHARNLSEAMHGAALLYNLLLARRRENSEWTKKYEKRMSEWEGSVRERWSDLKEWYSQLSSFWKSNPFKQVSIPRTTKDFVTQWLGHLFKEPTPERLAKDESVARLIADREWHLKRKRARLSNPRALEMWQGASGTRQLTYRWQNASTIVRDILNGLNQEGKNA